MKKIFDESGNFELQFAAESTDQIKKWLQPVEYSHAIKFAKEVNCPVFGKALQFPCRIEAENLNKPQEQPCNIHDVVRSYY